MSGVDSQNQFPGSFMALAVKLGQSRFISTDASGTPMGEQNNVDISAATTLTIPSQTVSALDGAVLKPTYAVITATGGPLYYTIDGTVPSATNNAGQIASGNAVPFYGLGLMTVLKIIGTTMNVGYYR